MKKLFATLLASALVLSLAACGSSASTETSTDASTEVSTSTETSTEASTEVSTSTEASVDAPADEAVMSYADYVAAELGTDVTVEFTVQDTQSWWDNKITVYGADADGAYFVYNMACSEEDAEKLVAGTVIRVSGARAEWMGEVEIGDTAMGDAPSFEFVEKEGYIAPAKDATALLGTEELASLNNQLVSFTDMTVTAVSYKNNEPGDDIYVNLSKNDVEYYFCLEYYLNGSNDEFYNLVGNLEVGSVVDVECYLYWYDGPNGHLTSVVVK